MTTLTDNPTENIEMLKKLTSQVYADAPIVGDLCLCQGILESRLLGAPSGLARDANNLFGIKGTGTAGSVYLWTWEHINGKDIQVKAAFSKNLTIEDSLRQHRHVLELPRYRSVWLAKSFEEAANQIRLDGYATDPNYSTSLIEIYNNHVLNS